MATIGNSITHGALLTNPETECYPAQLSDMLSEIYGDTVEISNFSVSGRTMMRSAENPLWNEPQFASALKYVPDICLILLGTNDSKPYRWDAWGSEFLGDYLTMIDTFKFRNPDTKFIVCYPPPIWEGHPYGTTYSNSHNDSVVINCVMPAIDTVVQITGAKLIDFHTPFVDSMNLFPDKLHPNSVGSGHMAKILFDTIVKTDLVHQVDAGKAFVVTFEQVNSSMPLGDSVEFKWTTILADSVFLEGVPVEKSGNKKVIAADKTYTLTAKGSENTSEYTLHLNTYNPLKSGLFISTSSSDYEKGKPVILYSDYMDQYNKLMSENTNSVTWKIIEGVGKLGEQTDTSIVFIPNATGTVVIEAKEGELTKEITLSINSLSSTSQNSKIKEFKIYPNPVKNILHLQVDNLHDKNIQIKVFNLLGEQVLEQNYNMEGQDNSEFTLNTSELCHGVYVCGIFADAKVKFGQFIKSVNYDYER